MPLAQELMEDEVTALVGARAARTRSKAGASGPQKGRPHLEVGAEVGELTITVAPFILGAGKRLGHYRVKR